MTRRVPIVPTILVALAVAAMIGLGLWQLQPRGMETGADRPLRQCAKPCRRSPGRAVLAEEDALPLFRRATGYCAAGLGKRSTAGQNRSGEIGYVHIADCASRAEGPGMSVEIGWSKNPNAAYRLAGRTGQRDHRARPGQADAAGAGHAPRRAASQAAERVGIERDPPDKHRAMPRPGSPSPQSR